MSLETLAPSRLEAIEAELRRAIGSQRAHHAEYLARRGPAGPGDAHPLSADYLSDYYAMLEYHLGWAGGVGGGKRIRPLLCLLACQASGGDWQQALPVAAAIELIHNFSLIHDDIQDNSPLRRGRPTVWNKWGQAQAINAGDAMFTLAHLAPQQLTELGLAPEVTLSALAELNYTCLELTQGQFLDMAFEQRPAVTVTEYLAMIEKKTAVLIATATYLGARVAGASPALLDHYYAFGWNLGLAFQLQDDVLGIWGDPVVTGKSAASDLEKRKKSLPVVFGLEHSASFAAAYARPHTPGEPVADLVAILDQVGARAEAERRAHEATHCAETELAKSQPAEPAAQALRELTQQLLHRKL
jgi:geranylgeranyl diphosphate synthase type I